MRKTHDIIKVKKSVTDEKSLIQENEEDLSNVTFKDAFNEIKHGVHTIVALHKYKGRTDPNYRDKFIGGTVISLSILFSIANSLLGPGILKRFCEIEKWILLINGIRYLCRSSNSKNSIGEVQEENEERTEEIETDHTFKGGLSQ